ncbi:MAG: 3'-5' exonuclease, partial [Candidatus Latescibacteria bacterium]|nr:3'-5' exonuclease [Candidatus Latescibacterota bacterium]
NGAGEDAILSENASPGDFLILTRTSGYLSHYAQALEERGIPFDITGGSRLGEADVLHTLVDFLETVYMPDNPLPLLAYLRGDLVGVGDDALYAFKKSGGVFNWKHGLPEGMDAKLRGPFEEAFGHLKEASVWLQSLSPGAAITRCIEMLGLLPFVRALPMGATQSGNLVRILSLIHEWGAGGLHWGQIVTELRALIDDRDYKVEQMTLASGQEDVVRLMNLHQSKGLQGKVVFLADPYDTSYTRFGPEFHVSRAEGEPFLAMPISKPKGPFAREVIAEPVGWGVDEAEEARFMKGEELRLLYVAATRAENLLVVSKYDEKPKDGPWSPLYPFLESVPELVRYPVVKTAQHKTQSVDLEQERSNREAFWASVQKASFEVEQVTDDRAGVGVTYSGEGRGVAFGTVIHRLFDGAINERLPDDPTSYVKHLLHEEGGDSAFLSDALCALQDFQNSEIWEELQAAERMYTEVPFAVAGTEKVIRGVIDLVYRLPDGWKIVDYKTNAVKTEDEVKALCEQSAEQVNAYAEHWMDFAGESVVGKGLWLTAKNLFVEI